MEGWCRLPWDLELTSDTVGDAADCCGTLVDIADTNGEDPGESGDTCGHCGRLGHWDPDQGSRDAIITSYVKVILLVGRRKNWAGKTKIITSYVKVIRLLVWGLGSDKATVPVLSFFLLNFFNSPISFVDDMEKYK